MSQSSRQTNINSLKTFLANAVFTKQARFAVVKSMIVWTGVWMYVCACMCVRCKYKQKDDLDTVG